VLASAGAENPLYVSDITLWEVATLYSLKRITLDRPLRVWLEQATAPPLVNRVGISPAVAAEAARIPDSFHRDPADRIIVATAMVLGAVVLTTDRRIREASLVPTV
jgi:PIN domain nuclease of toxin-antitoxin system